MISVHRATKGVTNVPWGFVPTHYNCSTELWHWIKDYTWSPIVFAKNYRTSDNYLFADVAGFDFDNDELDEKPEYTIDQAKRDFDGLRVIIGTTRSHQLGKNGAPPVDKFRVIVPFAERITDKQVYRATMRYYARMFDCDRKATDAGRQFYPCRELVYARDGDRLPIVHPTDEELKAEERAKEIDDYKSRVNPLPPHVRDFIYLGKPFGGSRNNSVYVSTLYLISKGHSFEEIVKMLTDSPFDRRDFHDKELIASIRSAYKKS